MLRKRFRPSVDGLELKLALAGSVTVLAFTITQQPNGTEDTDVTEFDYTDPTATVNELYAITNPSNPTGTSVVVNNVLGEIDITLTEPLGNATINAQINNATAFQLPYFPGTSPYPIPPTWIYPPFGGNDPIQPITPPTPYKPSIPIMVLPYTITSDPVPLTHPPEKVYYYLAPGQLLRNPTADDLKP